MKLTKLFIAMILLIETVDSAKKFTIVHMEATGKYGEYAAGTASLVGELELFLNHNCSEIAEAFGHMEIDIVQKEVQITDDDEANERFLKYYTLDAIYSDQADVILAPYSSGLTKIVMETCREEANKEGGRAVKIVAGNASSEGVFSNGTHPTYEDIVSMSSRAGDYLKEVFEAFIAEHLSTLVIVQRKPTFVCEVLKGICEVLEYPKFHSSCNREPERFDSYQEFLGDCMEDSVESFQLTFKNEEDVDVNVRVEFVPSVPTSKHIEDIYEKYSSHYDAVMGVGYFAQCELMLKAANNTDVEFIASAFSTCASDVIVERLGELAMFYGAVQWAPDPSYSPQQGEECEDFALQDGLTLGRVFPNASTGGLFKTYQHVGAAMGLLTILRALVISPENFWDPIVSGMINFRDAYGRVEIGPNHMNTKEMMLSEVNCGLREVHIDDAKDTIETRRNKGLTAILHSIFRRIEETDRTDLEKRIFLSSVCVAAVVVSLLVSCRQYAKYKNITDCLIVQYGYLYIICFCVCFGCLVYLSFSINMDVERCKSRPFWITLPATLLLACIINNLQRQYCVSKIANGRWIYSCFKKFGFYLLLISPQLIVFIWWMTASGGDTVGYPNEPGQNCSSEIVCIAVSPPAKIFYQISVVYTCFLAVYGAVLSSICSFKEPKLAVFLSCLFTLLMFGASFTQDYSWFTPTFRYITIQICGLIAVCSLSFYVIREAFLDEDEANESDEASESDEANEPDGPGEPGRPLLREPCEQENEYSFHVKLILRKDLRDLEWIGSGQHGDVFKANYNGVEVTCKVTDSEHGWKELQNLDYLRKKIDEYPQNREYVIRFDGVCIDYEDGKICLVCAYHPGGNLLTEAKNYKSHGRGLGIRHVRSTALEMTMGVEYLHTYNILHRDIKLDNYVRSKAGTVVLTDLGLSRKCDENGVHESKDDGGAEVVANWPPERIKCPDKSTKACDIYMLGLAFKELKRYYKYCDPGDLHLQIEFFKVIEHCLEENPDDRPEIDVLVQVLKCMSPLDEASEFYDKQTREQQDKFEQKEQATTINTRPKVDSIYGPKRLDILTLKLMNCQNAILEARQSGDINQAQALEIDRMQLETELNDTEKRMSSQENELERKYGVDNDKNVHESRQSVPEPHREKHDLRDTTVTILPKNHFQRSNNAIYELINHSQILSEPKSGSSTPRSSDSELQLDDLTPL